MTAVTMVLLITVDDVVGVMIGGRYRREWPFIKGARFAWLLAIVKCNHWTGSWLFPAQSIPTVKQEIVVLAFVRERNI